MGLKICDFHNRESGKRTLKYLFIFKMNLKTWTFNIYYVLCHSHSLCSPFWALDHIWSKDKNGSEFFLDPFWNTLEAVALGCNELLPLLSPGTAQLHRSPHPQGYTSHYLSTSPSSTVCKMLWYLLFSPVSFRLWSCRTITGGAALQEELQFPT